MSDEWREIRIKGRWRKRLMDIKEQERERVKEHKTLLNTEDEDLKR